MTTLDIHCRSENTTFVKLKEALPFTQTVYQTESRNLNHRYVHIEKVQPFPY